MTYAFAIALSCALFAAISWRDVRHGLFLLAAALPSYLLRFSIGPIPMTLLEAFALILIAVWIARILPRAKPRELFPRGWIVPTAVLLVAASVSVLAAPDAFAALGIWKAYFVEPVLVFVVATDLMRRHPEDRDNLLLALEAGGAFVALCAILQSLTGLGIPAPWDVEGRVVGIFPYPNAVGLYLAPVIVVGVVEWWSGGVVEGWKRLFWTMTAAASMVAIVLSQSEAAIVAVVATLLIAGIADKRFRKAAVALAVLGIVAAAAFPTLRAKLTFDDYSGHVRRSQWSETVDMLADHPLLGAGLSGYPAAMEPYHEDVHYEIFQYPHTLALNVWTELGALGLVALALMALAVLRQAGPALRGACLPAGGRGTPPVTIAFFALLAMTIHGLADVSYFKNDLAMMTWLFLAVIAVSAYAKNHGQHA